VSDPDEWQKSEAQRRSGPEKRNAQSPDHERDGEHDSHLIVEHAERIEENVREVVAATHPAVSDS
jgi:hypothetical protein